MKDKEWQEVLSGLKQALDTGIYKTPEEERFILYYLFAEKFGWTPEQVDRLTLKEKEALLVLIYESYKKQEFELSMMEKRRLK